MIFIYIYISFKKVISVYKPTSGGWTSSKPTVTGSSTRVLNDIAKSLKNFENNNKDKDTTSSSSSNGQQQQQQHGSSSQNSNGTRNNNNNKKKQQ